jgi:hypothetical protein
MQFLPISPANVRQALANCFLILTAAVTTPIPTELAAHEIDSPAGPAVLLAAGDIGNCKKTPLKRLVNWWAGENRYFGAHRTAGLLAEHPGKILVLGDLVYRYGKELDVNRCFHPTWGKFKDRIAPVPGNHDYDTPEGRAPGWDYFGYWGRQAGPKDLGYYSFPHGTWHIVALNSQLDDERLRRQTDWLRRDLAATDARCILAFWHIPVFSSGHHGDSQTLRPAYRILYNAGASVVLAAHEHNYERLAPLSPDGTVDRTNGIRSFIVGTGGHRLRRRSVSLPRREGSVALDASSWGVLKLNLHDGFYTWRFLAVAGHTFRDRGIGHCVERKQHWDH